MILQYFRKKENEYKIQADLIYVKILDESKLLLKKKFIKEINFDSTFELISILLIIHIKSFNNQNILNANKIKEELIKNFVNDLDTSLREFGIGDMSIGKYVKKYVKKFYYRVKVLDPLLSNDENFDQLSQFLGSLKFVNERNINNMCKYLLDKYHELKEVVITSAK